MWYFENFLFPYFKVILNVELLEFQMVLIQTLLERLAVKLKLIISIHEIDKSIISKFI